MEQVWQAVIAAAGPALAALIGFFKVERGSRIGRRIREHSRLLGALPEKSEARTALEDLLAFEAAELRDREIKRASRKVNIANVVGSVVTTVIAVVGIYLLAQWGLAAANPFWRVVAWTTTGVLGLFLALVVGAVWTTIFTPPSTKTAK